MVISSRVSSFWANVTQIFPSKKINPTILTRDQSPRKGTLIISSMHFLNLVIMRPKEEGGE